MVFDLFLLRDSDTTYTIEMGDREEGHTNSRRITEVNKIGIAGLR